MKIAEGQVFVAGCEPNIRAFNLATGANKLYEGHRGWILCLEIMDDKMYTGGDDQQIFIWSIETTKVLYKLCGHENSISTITFAFGDIYTGSLDHHVIAWDLLELQERIEEKEMMRLEDIDTRRYEAYWNIVGAKKGKKGKKGGAKGKGKKGKK